MSCTRRDFLWALALSGLALPLLRCGSSRGPDPQAVARQARDYDPNLQCTDTRGLWPAEVRTREDNRYVEASPSKLKYCFNCTNFVRPKQPGLCGGCQTLKGLIHPLGWCTAWTLRS